MKTIFKLIIAWFALVGFLPAQEEGPPQPTGFIRLVNGVSQGTGPVFLTINGEDIRPSGYKLGDATGGIGLRPGSHKVSIKRDGVREGVTTVILAKDQTVTLIPLLRRCPRVMRNLPISRSRSCA